MAKTILAGILTIFFLVAPSAAEMTGVGANGGILIPVVQEDQETGHTFGLKARFKLIGPIMMEPNVSFSGLGEKDLGGLGTRDGFNITHYGLDLTVGGGLGGPGLRPYLLIGGGVYNLKRDGDDTVNKSGWSFGAGTNLGLGMVELDLRGRFIIISTENSSSKKSAGITAGVTYYFGGE